MEMTVAFLKTQHTSLPAHIYKFMRSKVYISFMP